MSSSLASQWRAFLLITPAFSYFSNTQKRQNSNTVPPFFTPVTPPAATLSKPSLQLPVNKIVTACAGLGPNPKPELQVQLSTLKQ